ncbi:hypothetical protein GH714_020033 [Hevea brasiliensis]|uniref:Uncharacterized protein n=1 Tax=Hevea brasiliensis TaxID=3981 RepID=A0A6A6LAW9_HEVBR|nr:hypothetical protein GH714_020033 [Hevea brasiliensis]
MAKVDFAKAKLDEVAEGNLKLPKRIASHLVTCPIFVYCSDQVVDACLVLGEAFYGAIEVQGKRVQELLAMDVKTLEEEYKALLSDKAGELEYLQSLQGQVEKLKVNIPIALLHCAMKISHMGMLVH